MCFGSDPQASCFGQDLRNFVPRQRWSAKDALILSRSKTNVERGRWLRATHEPKTTSSPTLCHMFPLSHTVHFSLEEFSKTRRGRARLGATCVIENSLGFGKWLRKALRAGTFSRKSVLGTPRTGRESVNDPSSKSFLGIKRGSRSARFWRVSKKRHLVSLSRVSTSGSSEYDVWKQRSRALFLYKSHTCGTRFRERSFASDSRPISGALSTFFFNKKNKKKTHMRRHV